MQTWLKWDYFILGGAATKRTDVNTNEGYGASQPAKQGLPINVNGKVIYLDVDNEPKTQLVQGICPAGWHLPSDTVHMGINSSLH